SIYSTNRPTSLAKLLSDEGYETAFSMGLPMEAWVFRHLPSWLVLRGIMGKRNTKTMQIMMVSGGSGMNPSYNSWPINSMKCLSRSLPVSFRFLPTTLLRYRKNIKVNSLQDH